MDRDEKSPKTADEQEYPEQERMVTPEEEAGMELQELDNPPQAEGPRDTENDDARGSDGRRRD